MNWGNIKDSARLRLRDPNGVIWSDETLLSYANRTLEEVTRESEGNVKHIIFPIVSGTRSYTLPSDFYELRDVNINGKKIFGKQPYELEDLDQTYLTATGTPEYYYQEDSKTLSFYKIPSWTSTYTSFDSEFGEITDWAEDSSYLTMTSEFGVVTDIVSDSSVTYFEDSIIGAVVAADGAMLTCKLTYVYQPSYLASDEDEPDLPDPYQYIVTYGVIEKALRRDGQGKNEKLAQRYATRKMELQKEFLARQKEMAHGKDQILGMIQMSYGAERDYSMRVWR